MPFSVSFSVSLAVSRLGVQPFAHRGFGVSLTVSLAVSFSVSLAVSLSASAAPEGFRAQSRPMDGDASSACAGQISGAMFAALVRRVRRVRRRVCPCSVVRRLAVSFWRSTVCGGACPSVFSGSRRFGGGPMFSGSAACGGACPSVFSGSAACGGAMFSGSAAPCPSAFVSAAEHVARRAGWRWLGG